MRAVLLAALCRCTDGASTHPAGAAAIGFVTENGTRTPVALLGARGLLTSDSTRIDGLVTPQDVSAGRATGRSRRHPAAALRTLDRRIERNDRWRLPLTIALATLLIVLAAVRPRLALRALLVALAANLWLSPVLALVAGVAVLVLPLGLACAAILAAYLVSMGLDAETVALSPFGPSQSGRFYGVNNLLETMLLAPALVGAALLGRWGIGVAALAFVDDRRQSLRRRRRRDGRPRRRLPRAAAPAAGTPADAAPRRAGRGRSDRARAAPARARRGDRWLEPRHRCRRRRPGGARARHRRPGRALGAPHRRRRRGDRRRARLARDPDHDRAPRPPRTRARCVPRRPGGLAPCQRHARRRARDGRRDRDRLCRATRPSASR